MINISHYVLIIILNNIFYNIVQVKAFQSIRSFNDIPKRNTALHKQHLYKSDKFEGANNIDVISNELLSNDISYIKIVPSTKLDYRSVSNEDTFDANKFSSIFRHSAPYISMHRGNIMVIHISGGTISNREVFDGVMDDISILHLLGIKLVLVAGVREQLDKRIIEAGYQPSYSNGMRITDDFALKLLKEESGKARFEIESALARGFRGMTDRSGIDVVSGNFFYSAKPLGVLNGIDFKFTGEVRRIEQDNFRRRLDGNDIVLLTSVGYSTSGEVFSVPSESLAAECAAKLKASKIIYITSGEMMIDSRSNNMLSQVQSLRLNQACALLDKWGMHPKQYNYMENENENNDNDRSKSADVDHNNLVSTNADKFYNTFSYKERIADNITTNISAEISSNQMPTFLSAHNNTIDNLSDDKSGASSTSAPFNGVIADSDSNSDHADKESVASFIRLLARCVYALTGGVRRAHLIGPSYGALLKELFTRDGSGTLISRDMYEGIRTALPSDLRSIQEILRPLEEEGILIPRSSEDILKDLPNISLLTRDGAILACGMLKRYSPTHAELACLAVHPQYRKSGRGETLLAYLERRALLMGVTHIFLLSTRTMQWFDERGFKISDPSVLPPTRAYNTKRASKVYIKVLGTQRDVEVEELLWGIA